MALLIDALLGVIVGGIIGFVSSFGVNRIDAYLTRPILSISEETTKVSITLFGERWQAIRIRVEIRLTGLWVTGIAKVAATKAISTGC